jgi:hypothetical protein
MVVKRIFLVKNPYPNFLVIKWSPNFGHANDTSFVYVKGVSSTYIDNVLSMFFFLEKKDRIVCSLSSIILKEKK